MARGRIISKSLGSSRKFYALLQAGGKLGEFCQVLYPLLITNADECGRLPGDAFTIKNVVLPTSPRPERDFERALVAITSVGLIDRYAVDDAVYVSIRQFEEFQHLNLKHRGTSRYPGADAGTPIEDGSAVLRRSPPKTPLSLSLSSSLSLSGSSSSSVPPPSAAERVRDADSLFAQFWEAYPKKKAKEDAQRAWDKRRPNDDLLAVMLAALARQTASPDWQKESGRYIPLPASWLNKARWTDEVDVDLAAGGLSDTARYNLAASEEAEKLILEAEARRTGTHGHRR